MDALNDIFGQSKSVKGVGDVYPIKLNQYLEFMNCAHLLRFTKKHFEEEVQKEYSLFELSVTQGMKLELIEPFLHMLHLVTKNKFRLDIVDDSYVLLGDKNSYIDNRNFEQFRDIVMKQNLLYEDKVFKNPMVKRWADKVLETRNKNSVDMSLEDIVSVVHVFTGRSYDEISNYTIYQLKHTFERVLKVEDFRRDIQLLCAGSEKIKPTPYMEKIELYKDPYSDVFVDKSKLKNLNKVFNT